MSVDLSPWLGGVPTASMWPFGLPANRYNWAAPILYRQGPADWPSGPIELAGAPW